MRLPAAIAGGVVYPPQEQVFYRPTFSYLAEQLLSFDDRRFARRAKN